MDFPWDTAPYLTLLESSRVELITCNAATYRFRDIPGQKQKSASERPKIEAFLTTRLQTTK